MSAPLAAFGATNTVFKSGPLFISSKGLGWKSWKKRWFILTRTSLVFFKNDPSALPQGGGEVNLTLGGIDLNNSGSVVVREDKKLLTVLFPDGRDGRAFTLKAESSEDLYEWKTALEHALAQAPSAALVTGHNGIFRNDANDNIEGSYHQWRDKRPVKSLVVGRPILLALEDIDGGPSFLEKALRFLEKYGIKVEGILRQSADVEEVDRRVQEYEQGNSEFGPDEDAHVVGDCVKHVLRELPSSPVPASCCTALLEAYKIDRKEARVNAMRSAILETFPEPNRRLLQRILKMMHMISLHASENRMMASAVAACMAPLLLRPLLAGECKLEDDFELNIDNSAQLLAAANAANNAQAIITTLLEEYENIFDDDAMHRCSISADSRIVDGVSEDSTDEENLDIKDDGYHDAEYEVDQITDNDPDRVLSGKLSESSGYAGSDLYKSYRGDDSDVESPRDNLSSAAKYNPHEDSQPLRDSNVQVNEQEALQKKANENEMETCSIIPDGEPHRSMGEILYSINQGLPQSISGPESCVEKPMSKLAISDLNVNRSTFWGRSTARKTHSVESIDSSGEEELAIQRLEITKNDLRHRIAKEARGNAILQASLERRKQALHERRLALEQDVSRLQEQLQAETDLRAALEVGLSMSSGQFSSSNTMDSKTRAELEEIALAEADVARLKQKVAELHNQLNQQRHHHYGSLSDACDRYQHVHNHNSQKKCFQQDFDTTLALVNHEKKQRTQDKVRERELKDLHQSLAKQDNAREKQLEVLSKDLKILETDSKELHHALAMQEDARKKEVNELHHTLAKQGEHFQQAIAKQDDAREKEISELHLAIEKQDEVRQKESIKNIETMDQISQHLTLLESLLGADLRTIKGHVLTSGSSSKQSARNQFIDSTTFSDSKSTEASPSIPMDESCAVDSASIPSTSRTAEVIDYPRQQSVASSTLIELNSRLDFFKVRRSQLMEQLHNLDLNHGTPSSQDFLFKPSSPAWN